jgi:phosphoribosylaminoimidazolecarboxamide formyltransferase/IMP cyclohydrolase
MPSPASFKAVNPISPGSPEKLDTLFHSPCRRVHLILQIAPTYMPPEMESREIFGMTLQQKRNTAVITKETFCNVVTSPKQIPDDALETLLVATVALKYTQSNSVAWPMMGKSLAREPPLQPPTGGLSPTLSP